MATVLDARHIVRGGVHQIERHGFDAFAIQHGSKSSPIDLVQRGLIDLVLTVNDQLVGIVVERQRVIAGAHRSVQFQNGSGIAALIVRRSSSGVTFVEASKRSSKCIATVVVVVIILEVRDDVAVIVFDFIGVVGQSVGVDVVDETVETNVHGARRVDEMMIVQFSQHVRRRRRRR